MIDSWHKSCTSRPSQERRLLIHVWGAGPRWPAGRAVHGHTQMHAGSAPRPHDTSRMENAENALAGSQCQDACDGAYHCIWASTIVTPCATVGLLHRCRPASMPCPAPQAGALLHDLRAIGRIKEHVPGRMLQREGERPAGRADQTQLKRVDIQSRHSCGRGSGSCKRSEVLLNGRNSRGNTNRHLCGSCKPSMAARSCRLAVDWLQGLVDWRVLPLHSWLTGSRGPPSRRATEPRWMSRSGNLPKRSTA